MDGSPVIAVKPRQVLDILYGDGAGETSPVQSWVLYGFILLLNSWWTMVGTARVWAIRD